MSLKQLHLCDHCAWLNLLVPEQIGPEVKSDSTNGRAVQKEKSLGHEESAEFLSGT